MTTRRTFLSHGLAAASFLSPRLGVAGDGQTTPPVDRRTGSLDDPLAAQFAAIFDLFKSFMSRQGVSAGQLAICKDGLLRASYVAATPPPPGYAAVTNRTLFRLASCTKTYTCAGIQVLHDRGQLDLDAHVYSFLGIQQPAGTKAKPDPRINDITVRHLIDHAGGWNDHEDVRAKDGTLVHGTNRDPMFDPRTVARELNLSGQPTKRDFAVYMYGQPLQFTPGTQNNDTTFGKSYSNFGFVLLGLVIEKASGLAYADFIRSGLGPGVDTSDVFLGHALQSQRLPREVWFTDPGFGLTALDFRSQVSLPAAYGGVGTAEAGADSAGWLVTTAESYAQFCAHFAVWGMGPRAAIFGRTGGSPGVSAYATSRRNGVDCACLFNTRAFRESAAYDTFLTALSAMLDKL